MTEAIALALLKMLLAEAPGVVLWVLRKAGLVPDDAGHAPIENMRRAADVLVVNPMVKAAEGRRARVVPFPPPDQADEYRDTDPPPTEPGAA